MRVLSMKTLRDFWEKHPKAEGSLREWFQMALGADWGNFAAVRASCNGADQVDQFTVFDIGGNKFRLISVINFTGRGLYARAVLTHGDYAKGKWKEDIFGNRGDWLPRHRESAKEPAGKPLGQSKQGKPRKKG